MIDKSTTKGKSLLGSWGTLAIILGGESPCGIGEGRKGNDKLEYTESVVEALDWREEEEVKGQE